MLSRTSVRALLAAGGFSLLVLIGGLMAGFEGTPVVFMVTFSLFGLAVVEYEKRQASVR